MYKRILFFFAIAIGSFVIGIDFLAIGVAVEPMSKELNVGMTTLQWFLSAFAIGDSCFIVAAGKLCDLYGARKILFLGMVLFVLSSLLIACSSFAWLIIVGRTIQGIAAGFMSTASVSSVMYFIPEKKRTAWMAGVIGLFAAGTVLGPLIGGYLIHLYSWRWVFLINIPIGLLSLGAIYYGIPQHTMSLQTHQKIDTKGIVLLAISLFSLNMALSQGHGWGLLSLPMLITILIMVLAIILFVVHERRFANPIIEFAMFKVRNFLSANIVGFLLYFVIISWVLIYGVYMQQVMGMTPIESGEMFVPFGLMVVIIAPFIGRVTQHFDARRILLLAETFGVIAFMMMALLPVLPSHFVLGAAFMLFGMCFVTINSVSLPAGMEYIAATKIGIATGKSMMMRWLGGAIGASLLTLIFLIASLNKLSVVLHAYPKFNTAESINFFKQIILDQHPKMTTDYFIEHQAEANYILHQALHAGLQAAMWTLMAVCCTAFLVVFFGIKKPK